MRLAAGDRRLHDEIERNAAATSAIAREFLIGEEASSGLQQTSALDAAIQRNLQNILPSLLQNTMSSLLQNALPALLQNALAAQATQIADSFGVLEVTRGSKRKRDDEDFLREYGLNTAGNLDVFEAEVPLEITSFINERLAGDRRHLTNHIKPQFSMRLKKLRIDRFLQRAERFWVARVQSQWRIAYTEADRDLMQAVWDDHSFKLYVERQASLRMPLPPRAMQRARSLRYGPFHPRAKALAAAQVAGQVPAQEQPAMPPPQQ